MSLIDIIGYPVLDGIFASSVLCLLYVTSAVVIPSCLLLIAAIFTGRVVRGWWEADHVDSRGKYVLITGCDTGIGFSLAKLLDKRGFYIFATCLSDSSDGANDLRRSGSSGIRVMQLDVTSDDNVRCCLQKVQSICSHVGLWALVNNAGTSLGGDAELQPMSNFKYYADLNVFGVVRMCKAFLPLVRKTKGRIVNVTSVRGRLAFPTASPYCMSKFGAEGFSDSLRLEMSRFGVKIIVVEPGMYGLCVGQFNEKNREVMKALYQKMVDSVSDEVRSAYGHTYIQTFVNDIPKALPFSESNLRGVLEALESAVAGVHPRSRYLADSTNALVDGHCVCTRSVVINIPQTMARLRDILPEYLMDRILLWMRPLRKETYYAMNEK